MVLIYVDTLSMIFLLEVITTFIIIAAVWSGMHLTDYNYPVILILIYFRLTLNNLGSVLALNKLVLC